MGYDGEAQVMLCSSNKRQLLQIIECLEDDRIRYEGGMMSFNPAADLEESDKSSDNFGPEFEIIRYEIENFFDRYKDAQPTKELHEFLKDRAFFLQYEWRHGIGDSLRFWKIASIRSPNVEITIRWWGEDFNDFGIICIRNGLMRKNRCRIFDFDHNPSDEELLKLGKEANKWVPIPDE